MNKKITLNRFEIKIAENIRKIYGYASVFNITDKHNDIVLPGAFKETLTRYSSQPLKLLWQHDQNQQIGVIKTIYEDSHGLYLEAEFLKDTSIASEAYNYAKSNKVKGLSIGYSVIESCQINNIRNITKIELDEISLVTDPANELAQVTEIKTTGFNNLNAALKKAISILQPIN
jgi:HK97 family phage prohead protease